MQCIALLFKNRILRVHTNVMLLTSSLYLLLYFVAIHVCLNMYYYCLLYQISKVCLIFQPPRPFIFVGKLYTMFHNCIFCFYISPLQHWNFEISRPMFYRKIYYSRKFYCGMNFYNFLCHILCELLNVIDAIVNVMTGDLPLIPRETRRLPGGGVSLKVYRGETIRSGGLSGVFTFDVRGCFFFLLFQRIYLLASYDNAG